MSGTYSVGDGPLTVVMFHGYTNSPDHMQYLANTLARELSAKVIVPVLPGHGTSVTSLSRVSLDDYAAAAANHVRIAADRGEYMLVGYSFGSYLSVIAASRAPRPPKALVLAMMPLKLRFPFSSRFAESIAQCIPWWPKLFTFHGASIRSEMFFYRRFPGNSVVLLKQAIARTIPLLKDVRCPTMIIETKYDLLIHSDNDLEIQQSMPHAKVTNSTPANNMHELFFGSNREAECAEVVQFFKKSCPLAEGQVDSK